MAPFFHVEASQNKLPDSDWQVSKNLKMKDLYTIELDF